MKKKESFLIISFVALFLALGLTGCQVLSIVGTADPELSAQLVDEATQLMREGDWEGAMSKFSQAVLKDPSNGNAQMGYAFLSIASVAVDPKMVELAGNRLRFDDYPTSMNSFYSNAWFTKPVQDYGYYYNPETDTYDWGPLEVLYPEITVPEEIAVWEDGDASVITNSEYQLAFLYNFVNANPNGLNELFDSVIYDVLGKKLDLAISSIRSTPSNMTFNITYDMFSYDGAAPAGWPLDASGNPVTIVIGKEELLIISAGLKFLKSEFELFSSYSYSLPLTEYWEAFNPIDGTINSGTLDWGGLTTPFEAEFLFGRPDSQAKLDNARKAAAAALEDLVNSMRGIIEDRAGLFLSSTSPSTAVSSYWPQAVNQLKFAKVLFVNMRYSVRDNKPIYIPVDFNNYSSPEEFFAFYSNGAHWPKEPDWGSDWNSYDGTPPRVIAMNFGSLFSGNILAVNSLLELQDSKEPVLYKFTYTDANVMPFSATAGTLSKTPVSGPLSAAEVQENGVMYALKVRDLTLNGLFLLSTSTIDEIRKLISSEYNIPDLGDQLVVVNSDNSVSLFLPVVPPVFAAEAYGAVSGDSVFVNYSYLPSSGYNHTYYGSFWWAFPEYQNYLYTYMVDIFDLAIGVTSPVYTIDRYESIYFEVTGMDSSILYEAILNSDSSELYVSNIESLSTYSYYISNTPYITGLSSTIIKVSNYSEDNASFSIRFAPADVISTFPVIKSGSFPGNSDSSDYYILDLDPASYYMITLSSVTGVVSLGAFDLIDSQPINIYLYSSDGLNDSATGITNIDKLVLRLNSYSSEDSSYNLIVSEMEVTPLTPGVPLIVQAIAPETIVYYSVSLDSFSTYNLVASTDNNIGINIYPAFNDYSWSAYGYASNGYDANIAIPSGASSALIILNNYSDRASTCTLTVQTQ